MELFVRPAGPADAEEIAEVQRISWQSAYTGLLRPESLARVAQMWDARHWRRVLERVADDAIPLVLDGPETGVAGFGVAGPRRGGGGNPVLQRFAGEIYLLYLLPEVQGQGNGARLMAAMARVLRARGMNSALVWALAANRAGVGFYRHLDGTTLVQTRKTFLGESVEEIAFGWPDLEVLAGSSRNVRR